MNSLFLYSCDRYSAEQYISQETSADKRETAQTLHEDKVKVSPHTIINFFFIFGQTLNWFCFCSPNPFQDHFCGGQQKCALPRLLLLNDFSN